MTEQAKSTSQLQLEHCVPWRCDFLYSANRKMRKSVLKKKKNEKMLQDSKT